MAKVKAKAKVEAKASAKAAKSLKKGKIIKPDPEKDAAYYIKAARVSAMLDVIERRFDIVSNAIVPRGKVSTGILALDYLWYGGLQPGMYSIAGQSGAGKTTLAFSTLGEIIRQHIPMTIMQDAEGTTGGDVVYAENMLRLPLNTMTGKNGIKRVRLYQENVIEKMYDVMKAIFQQFPHKIYDAELEGWFYKASGGSSKKAKESRRRMLDLTGASESDCDKRNGNLYLPAPDRIEGAILVDSYASMVTELEDESDAEEGDNRMAAEAGAFSRSIRRIVSPLATKGFAILGTNQIRVNPRPMYGAAPEYEPGGNALFFYSSNSNQARTLSISSMKTKVCGQFERAKEDGMGSKSVEKSVEFPGKQDYYQYGRIQNKKNKLSTPFLSAEYRVWFRDGHNPPQGRGICPVFDAWQFMECQGLGRYNKKKLYSDFWDGAIDWYAFKRLILAEVAGDKKALIEACKAIGLEKILRLRAKLFEYIKEGKVKAYQVSADGDDDEDGEDDDRTTRV